LDIAILNQEYAESEENSPTNQGDDLGLPIIKPNKTGKWPSFTYLFPYSYSVNSFLVARRGAHVVGLRELCVIKPSYSSEKNPRGTTE